VFRARTKIGANDISNTYLEDIGALMVTDEFGQHPGNFDFLVVFEWTTNTHGLMKSAT
jgi:hypothetical protein